MDMMFVYMICLAICVALLAIWSQRVKERRRIRQKPHDTEEYVAQDEKVAPIMITNIDHYVDDRVNYGRGRSINITYTIKFSYFDEEGREHYGVYTTTGQGDSDRISKVAYRVQNPDQYRMLGRITRSSSYTRMGRNHEGLFDWVIQPILMNFLDKNGTEQVYILLKLGVFIFTILVVKGFYYAIFH